MNLLLELRTATAEVHQRLESRLDVLGRCRRPDGYADLLQGMRAAYAPLEEAVSACPATADAVPDWPLRLKTGWLDEDLTRLGVPPRAGTLPPPLAGTEDVLGTVYVMEGATLGAAVLVRELATLPAVPPVRFFTGYAGRRGAMWRAFRARVTVLEAAGLDAGRVVDAARRTFAQVERCCLPTTA